MANRSIRDDRGGPLMRAAPAAMPQQQAPSPATFQPRPAPLPQSAPTLATAPAAATGLPGQPAVQQPRVATPRPPLPPAPIPGATGPGTANPGMIQPSGGGSGSVRR